MANSIKGTKTEANLLKSFAGESQASMRYTLFAAQAEKEGYRQIAAVFRETADQEKAHAKRFFNFLEGGGLTITAEYPAGIVGTTAENLKAAMEGEHEEWDILYKEFAETAKAEGFPQIAVVFNRVADVEKMHEERYATLLARVSDGEVFEREEEIEWQCRECGYVHKGKTPPKVCPACGYPQEYYEPKKWNF